jgi:hypothetical protein
MNGLRTKTSRSTNGEMTVIWLGRTSFISVAVDDAVEADSSFVCSFRP